MAMVSGSGLLGTWIIPSTTATAGTAFSRLVPAFAGKGGAFVQKVDGAEARQVPQAYTHCDQITYTDAGTSHNLALMRPLNWTWITTAVDPNSTAVILDTDPGAYSTAFRYALPGAVTKPAGVANNAIAGNDFVAFQLKDGTWHVSTVASVSSLTLTLTTATPNVTGGGADANTVLYFFGISTDSVPQTGAAHILLKGGAGSTRVNLLPSGHGSFSALNPGDPLLFYSANATGAGILDASGFYADR